MRSNGTMHRTKFNQADLNRLQNLSVISSRLALSGRLGLSHSNDRDLYKTLGYPDSIESKDLIGQWRRQGIARAVVDRPVKSTWQGDLFITEPGDEEETELEKEYKTLEDRLKLKHRLMRVDRLACLGSYAVLLLGLDDVDGPDSWKTPVDPGDRKLLYVRPVGKENATIDSFENDASHPRFGMPRVYSIDLNEPTSNSTNSSKSVSLKVHHSRVIHVAYDLLENEVDGEPVMAAMYNRLKDLEKLVGGSAEMFWRGARPGYFGSAKEDYKVDDDTEKKLKEQIEEYEHDLRRFLMAEGVDMKSLEMQIADPKGHAMIQLQMISAASGIPLRILIGSERGELASSADQDNYRDYISNRRTEEVEPTVFRPFVDRLIKYGVLPEPKSKDEGYSVAWSDLFSMGEKEKAEIGQSRASALESYVKQPLSEEYIPLEGFLKFFLRMEEDEVTQLIEMRDAQILDLLEEEAEFEETEEETEDDDEIG